MVIVLDKRMIKISQFKGILIQKIPLLIIVMTLAIGLSFGQSPTILSFIVDSSGAISALTSLQTAFAAHGQEVTLTLYNSSFGSLTSGGGNQVSVFVSYKINENSVAGQTLNAVMEVYAPNETLIRTSSYPNGFVAQSSGGVEGLETTIIDSTIQSVTANVTFRSLDKTEVLSNDLRVNLNLDEEGTTLGATQEDTGRGEEALGSGSEQEPTSEEDVEDTGEEEGAIDGNEDGDEGEGQTIPIPLFGNE